MMDSGALQNQDADTASQRETPPRLMVGSWAGEVAVVEARTGRVCWLRRSRHQLGTFALDSETAFVAVGYSLDMFHQLPRTPQGAEWDRMAAQLDAPAHLEARRASDGALLWAYADWNIGGSLHTVANNGVVIAAGVGQFGAADSHIHALDAVTGAQLWTVEGSSASGGIDRLITACGGRVYIHLAGQYETISALDIRTGTPLWQRQWHSLGPFSPNGALYAEEHLAYDEGTGWSGSLQLISVTNGAESASVPLSGAVRALTNDGVCYVTAVDDLRDTWMAALDARTGAELWRTPGIVADYVALDGAILCYSRMMMNDRIVEIAALDAVTGRRLWQWRTPGSLGELLRLWGMRHMPLMAWESTKKSAAAVASIVTLRHPIGEAVRRRKRGRRRPSARWIALRHEFHHGQWRHPWQLHSAGNANWLVARWGIVFLGTWLGLFALDAASGQLLWHALPTIDLSFVDPALAP
ncbi:MAG TPA: PQQ-binding-like beta-propeller repeat protein [Ktedonobacterales bacterium]